MSPNSANELIEANKLHQESEVNIIENAGHHLYSDNHIGCMAAILGFTHYEDEKNSFLEQKYEEIERDI